MTMTPDAKKALSATIRTLHTRLRGDLYDATDAAYRLGTVTQHAGLSEAARAKRRRLELWIAEQQRADDRPVEDYRREATGQAAYTWLNRIVVLKILEATGLRREAVVGGGWENKHYKDFRKLADALIGDESEGYGFLLQLVFEELAVELPGIFGPAGVAELIPMPPATLRALIEAVNDPALSSCWRDDMTLGWVYQFWNDPDREALDAKLNSGGKVENHEIASKTQMFTERYMVDWLLQNSLGPLWLAMCRKHGWVARCESSGTLAALEARRVDWRGQREAGTVSLTALMPLNTDMERRWAYFLPQPIPADAIEGAPDSVRELKILDPAVGSGHFLMIAFDLLLALYEEEAAHRGEVELPRWSRRAIVERIVEHNLSGIDLDPRAVQIAAAALWVKAKQAAPTARPKSLNLVAASLRLAGLGSDDPARVALREEVERETGIPGALTDRIFTALNGADHLGSLLKVGAAVEAAITEHGTALSESAGMTPVPLFGAAPPTQQRIPISRADAAARIVERLEQFLSHHTSGDDLGLRLYGQQLAAGVRFVRMVREGQYHLVVGNPPYQGTSKMADSSYVKKHYKRGKADLYAAFMLRGLELARPGGVSAMLTMRNWMFIKQYADLRKWLLESWDLRALGDFDRGAFELVPDEVVSVVVSVFRKVAPVAAESLALQPTSPDDRTRDSERTQRKRGAVRCGEGRFEFSAERLKVVPEWPLVYWWIPETLALYDRSPLVGMESPARQGLATANNNRFLRQSFEVRTLEVGQWVPYIKGSEGAKWCDAISFVVKWSSKGLEIRAFERNGKQASRPQNIDFYFQIGVAFSPIGNQFTARIHRTPSIFGHMGSSVFPSDLAQAVCCLNSSVSTTIIQSLNPGVHFENGDVNRLPLFRIAAANDIVDLLKRAFTIHESHREPSVEFRKPGPSPWRHAQDWAQLAVDRPEDTPLPAYTAILDPEPPTDHISFALGTALGRFAADGSGILDPTTADLTTALPAGILFLDGTLAPTDHGKPESACLAHPAAKPLHAAWKRHGPAIETRRDTCRDYLRLDFFSSVHRQMYDNRPIHWPLSSAKKTFVAWVTIHRMSAQTLPTLLADHLLPTRARLQGELPDLRASRDGTDAKAARAAERRLAVVQKWLAELETFIDDVTACGEQGAPPVKAGAPKRAADARYAPDLDDGVMINAAALWPLLAPQWKDPKKWWGSLAVAKKGSKDYDWSHLAARYFPKRVDLKCRKDPSLGVAHGCFWRYHPARAWAWELRLQNEIAADFRIEEAPYQAPGDAEHDGGHLNHRADYLRDHHAEALAAVEKEAIRRIGRGASKAAIPSMALLEVGLWGLHARACWDLESRIIDKQEAAFVLGAPDEVPGRAALLVAEPGLAAERKALLEAHGGQVGLFGG